MADLPEHLHEEIFRKGGMALELALYQGEQQEWWRRLTADAGVQALTPGVRTWHQMVKDGADPKRLANLAPDVLARIDEFWQAFAPDSTLTHQLALAHWASQGDTTQAMQRYEAASAVHHARVNQAPEITLRLNGIDSLPPTLEHLKHLKRLTLVGADSIKSLPENLAQLTDLEEVCVQSARELQTWPQALSAWTALHVLKLDGAIKMQDVDATLANYPQLRVLEFTNCHFLQTMPTLHVSPNLQKLKVVECPNLESGSLKLPALSTLELRECRKLTKFSLQACEQLQKVVIWNCKELTTLGALDEQLLSLPGLSLGFCPKLTVSQRPHGAADS